MKKSILMVLVLLSCAIFLNTATADDFKAAVDKAAKDFGEATASKNDAKLGSMYAEDAIAFPPNADMVKGRAAIQAFWKGLIDAGMKATLEPVDTESEGNLGIEVGKYTILDASGKTVDQGKYVVTWKKGNDGWKLYRDIWNSSMPAAPPAK
jgi:ketosteroid isomerase-like protein